MKRVLLTTLLSAASILAVDAQKPILPDFHADPSIHIWDGKYWIYPSTDEPGSTTWDQMCRWHCYSSTNLIDWSCEGQIFSLEDVSWADHAAFAPDAVKRNGRYYYFFPAGMQIGVAVSDSPTGPFKDALGKPLITTRELPKIATFDPCIFVDDDNTPYLYWGNSWSRAGMVKMKDNLLERAEELREIELPGYAEGIWVFKRGETYYFTYPDHTKVNGENRQQLVYCTAPTPYGPFTYQGQFLDNKSRNSHPSIIEIEGQWYLFYHIQGPSPYERRVCAEYLEFDKRGLIKPVKMTKRGIRKGVAAPPMDMVR